MPLPLSLSCTCELVQIKPSSPQFSVCSLHSLKTIRAVVSHWHFREQHSRARTSYSSGIQLPVLFPDPTSLIGWAWASSLISLCLSFQILRWGLEAEPVAVGSYWGLSGIRAQVKEWNLMGSMHKRWRSWFWASILHMVPPTPAGCKNLEVWSWSSSIATPRPWAQSWQQSTQQAHAGQQCRAVPSCCGATLCSNPWVLAMWPRNRAQDSFQYIADERKHKITNLMKKSF